MKQESIPPGSWPHGEPLRVRLAARLRRSRPRDVMTLLAEILLAVIIVTAIFGPHIAPYNPLRVSVRERLEPPSWKHLLGTDEAGRDVLSRLMVGTRITMFSVLLVLCIVTFVGVIVGAVAGYVGGILDEVLMRVGDLVIAFPPLVLAMALAAALGAGLTSAIIAVAFVRWPRYARLVRGQVLSLKNKAFVEAARSMGVPPWRILFRHILVNSLDPIIVRVTVDSGYVILTTASLGFIGLGAQPPDPEWGVMVAAGRTFMLNSPWVTIFPGLAIVLAVMGFTLVGDELRDRLDPTLRPLAGQ